MKELGEALRSIFERIGQFLDLFDLSFFISGSVATGAIWMWLHEAKRLPSIQLSGWLHVLTVVIGIYAAGLICFSVGRLFRTIGRAIEGRRHRRTPFWNFDRCLLATVTGHGLEKSELFAQYLRHSKEVTGIRGAWMLYGRLWAELRSDGRMAASMSVLNRYWVMAATYDGLAFATLLWGLTAASFAFGWGVPRLLDHWLGVVACIASAFFAWACLREAARYAEYQIYELVASTATRLSLPPRLNIPAEMSPGARRTAPERGPAG